MPSFEQILPVVFGAAAVIYLGMSAYASNNATDRDNTSISYLLLLIGVFIGGAALWYGASDMILFYVGRVLTLFAAGFMPVGFYLLYREYAGIRPSAALLAALSVIPMVTTGLAITNPWHGLVWDAVMTEGAIQFSHVREHTWFRLVSLPYAYSLFGYSLLALTGRLSSIAKSHRGRVILLLFCAVMPFIVNVANTILDIGPYEFPFTATTLVALLPLYWWAAIRLRVANFMPVAYQTLFDHVQDAIIVLDDRHNIVSVNRGGEELLGAREVDLVGKPVDDAAGSIAREVARSESPYLSSTISFDGSHYLDLSIARLSGPRGDGQGLVVVCRDITERRKTQQALADSEHLIRSLVENSSNGMLRFGRHGQHFRCTFANRAAAEFLAAGDRDLVGAVLDEFPTLDPERLMARFGKSRPRREDSKPLEHEVQTRSGDRWLKLVAEPIGDDFSVTLVDITQNKAAESRIMAEALQDPLTGVLNRRGFEESAAERFAEFDCSAVIYLDLDGFKRVNDSFGHPTGDALLKAFGHRLAFCLRPEDVVGRLGGDEFAIMLPDISDEHARAVAERLVESASEPYLIQGKRIHCAASVGVALKPRHGNDLMQLIHLADEAMYLAKSQKAHEAANDRSAYVEASDVG